MPAIPPTLPHTVRNSSKLPDILSNYSVPIAALCLLALWAWNTLTPQQLFATEEERREFLQSIDQPPSIRIITLVTEWCPACKQLEHQLTEDGVPHVRLDIEKDPAGEQLFRRVYGITNSNAIPQIVLDRDIVSRPKLLLELAKEPSKQPQQ